MPPSFSTLITPEEEEVEKGSKREKKVVALHHPMAAMSIWRTWPTPYTICNFSYRSRTSRNRRKLSEKYSGRTSMMVSG
jgi:hypothetical protein